MRFVNGMAISVLLFSIGCASSRDLTPSITGSRVLGECYQLKHDMQLAKMTELGWNAVVPLPDPRPGSVDVKPWRAIDALSAGNEIVVEKVIEYHYGGFALAPDRVNFTFGRIRTGPHASKVVQLDNAGISVLEFGSLQDHVDETYVRPCGVPATSESADGSKSANRK